MTLFSTMNGSITDWIKNAASFDVEPGDYYGTGQLPLPNQGVFLSEHRFVVAGKSLETEIGAISPLEPLAG
jgi:hypothetical protein